MTIGATSTHGEGSTFWLDMPLAGNPLDRDTGPTERLLDGQTAARDATPSTTILYIEDNLSNFRLVERILGWRPGVELLTAMQGGLGLALAREHRPDLILLDLHLPDLPGPGVLHRLQEDPETKSIPVVVVSADATPRQIERLLAAGAHAYVTKPLDVQAFLSVVGEALTKTARQVLPGQT